MPSYRSSEPTVRPDHVPPGEYLLEILNAEESLSKAGNEQIELRLRVEPSGALLYDHLVFIESAFWKIDQFRASIGHAVRPDEEVEVVADELIGRKGRARLGIEDFDGRKRNKVIAWLPPKPAAVPAPQSAKGGTDDDRPF